MFSGGFIKILKTKANCKKFLNGIVKIKNAVRLEQTGDE